MRSGLVDEPATTAEALGRPARGDAAAVGFAFPDTLPAATNGRTGGLTAGLAAGLTAGLAASDLAAGFREVEAPVFATTLAVLDAATTFFDDFTAVAPDALRTGAAATLLAGLTAGLAATFAFCLAVELEVFATAVALRTVGAALATAGRVTFGVDAADFLAEAGAAVPDEGAAVWADVAMERLQKIAILRIVSGPVRSGFLGTRHHY